jgi:hypothetical protein
MANRVGQQLGNYRLLRLLGRGGFASNRASVAAELVAKNRERAEQEEDLYSKQMPFLP